MSTPVFHRSSSLRMLNALLAVIMVTCVTWGLLSASPLRAVRGTPLQWIRHVDDVLIHLSLYSIITITLIPVIGDSQIRIRRLLIGAIAAHAITTELLQALIPGRTCDVVDLLANLAGIVLGLRMTCQLSRFLTQAGPLPATLARAGSAGSS